MVAQALSVPPRRVAKDPGRRAHLEQQPARCGGVNAVNPRVRVALRVVIVMYDDAVSVRPHLTICHLSAEIK